MRILFQSLTVLASLTLLTQCSSTGAATAGGADATTRDLTGTVSAGGLIAPSVSRSVVGKTTQLACSDVKLCCVGYAGGAPTVAALTETTGGDCTFTVTLPLNSFRFCALFGGADADSNSCPDTYMGGLGCTVGSNFAGALPIFADADDSTDAIDGGTLTVASGRVTASSDLCAQVDQDDDGTADTADTDEDGDGISDESDPYNDSGYSDYIDDYDADDDGTPDIYEDSWDDYADFDEDGIPNFAEEDIDDDGTANDDDTDDDGDGISDEEDTDDDGDGTADADESTDTDGDGIPDAFDDDADAGDSTGDDDGSSSLPAVSCTAVSDCSVDFETDYPAFSGAQYSESSFSCVENTCLYNCAEHAATFSNLTQEECEAEFTGNGFSCLHGTCQVYPTE